MSSDISRQRFNPANDFNSVLMQQGRVQLDADWNEWNEILDRHWRSETIDIIGRCVVPRETPEGFAIAISAIARGLATLTIGRGRIYVDGLQAENHGGGDLEFDPILGESRRLGPILYHNQRYFPNADPLPAGGPHLVYVDVWEREVTAIEDPDLVENAVGVDTTSRLQTVWQVRVLPDVGDDVTCSTPDDQVPGWLDIIQPSAGRLTTQAIGVPTTSDPCLIPPSGGYRGLENRTYRVEIQNGGALGTATFKWSRDNASIASGVSKIGNNITLTVDRVVWDSVRRFSPGDWVEITDDWREFSLEPGEMGQIDSVDDSTRTITLKSALIGDFPVDGQNLTDPERHTRIKRWDQAGIVKDSAGNNYVDLDAAGGSGVILVPPAGTSLILEDGVQVTLTTDPDGGEFRSGDYWVFVARTADASVEELDAAPPRGVHHHYGRLALVTFPATVVDCRIFWPPSFPKASESCDCTLCVTAEQHHTGTFTIQDAVNQLLPTSGVNTPGGTICLGPGIFILDKPVQLSGAFAVRIRGQGAATIIYQPKGAEAFIISELVAGTKRTPSQWCTLDYLTILTNGEAAMISGPQAQTHVTSPYRTAGTIAAPAIRLSNSVGTTIERVNITPVPPELGVGTSSAKTVALAGILLESGDLMLTKIRDNFITAQVGVGFDSKDPTDALVLLGFCCEGNVLDCRDTGIQLGTKPTSPPSQSLGLCYYLDTVIAKNCIIGPFDAGIVMTGFAFTELEVIANTVIPLSSTGDGMVFSIFDFPIIPVGHSGARICDNRVAYGQNGIRVESAVSLSLSPIVLSGNRLEFLSTNGIEINPLLGSMLSSALIENNILNMIGECGIGMGVERGGVDNLKILGNELTNIGASDSKADIAGISLRGVYKGAVSDNCIRDVGTYSPDSYSITGVLLVGVDMRISDNTIANIAPVSGFQKPVAGIAVAYASANIEINDNLIRRQISPPQNANQDNSPWQAVCIVNNWPYVRPDDAAGDQACIHGNSLHGYGVGPLVEVFVNGAFRFSDNQCSILRDQGKPAVDLRADTIIASANRIECSKNIFALFLKGASTTRSALNAPRAYTVLGNITGGEIHVSNALHGNVQLGNPWSPLNVQA